jgi:chorismate synthase
VTRLRYLTAGESHGPALVGILEGLPAGLPLTAGDLDRDLLRRQRGHGRGGRMKIEQDAAEILAGVRFGTTLGSPLALVLRNRDFESWTERMRVGAGGPDPHPVVVPRPGHADLAGGLKYGHTEDLRGVLERASARETAMRVALGGAARALLRELGIGVGSYVRAIGNVEGADAAKVAPELHRDDAEGLALLADGNETRAADESSSLRFVEAIDEARRRRDTVGGVIEVIATGMPVGLGSYAQWDRKLDGRIAAAFASIPAIKAVELGDGMWAARRWGSEVHDAIVRENERLARLSNHAGGLEGGVSDGEPLVVRAFMKPIATVPSALPSVRLDTFTPDSAHVERSDTCAVPAAGVIAEAVLALVVADAVLEALGGDTLAGLRLPFARLRLASRARVGHVFLLGSMGAGKTASGLVLARRLGRPFVDLDARIEARAGASISQLFDAAGEDGFREIEAAALQAACGEPPSVIALGGGAVLTEAAWRTVRRAGVTVRLSAPPRELARRIAGTASTRPLLAGADPEERLHALGQVRERWYARADLHVDTLGLSVDEVAGAVLGLLRNVEGPLSARVGATGRGEPAP